MAVAETALTITMVSAQETMTAPSASLAILPFRFGLVGPIWAVTFFCNVTFLDMRFQAGYLDCRF